MKGAAYERIPIIDFPVSSSRNDDSMVQRNQTRLAVSITKGRLVGLPDGGIAIISLRSATFKTAPYLARRVQYPFTTFTQALKTGSTMLSSIAGSSTKFSSWTWLSSRPSPFCRQRDKSTQPSDNKLRRKHKRNIARQTSPPVPL